MIEGLPLELARIASAAGVDAAWKIAEAKGGRRVGIPAQPEEGHWLTILLGLETAAKVCALYATQGNGAKNILIPMARGVVTRRLLAEALDKGMTGAQAAEYASVHERTVYRARARARQTRNKNQGSLF